MRRPGTRRPPALLAVLLLLAPASAAGQLISPGHLASPHAELEGMRECVSCHQLRRPGISPALCLDCHQPLACRIEAGRGLHAAPDAEECATCHKEHLGVDADLVRFDTTDFDHDRAGWTLEGAHTDLGCRDCHVPDRVTDPVVLADGGRSLDLRRTFLGLDAECRGCHAADDPHGGQFGDAQCTDCHDTWSWTDPPGFDHGRTRFALTGRHRSVECAGCHPSERSSGGGVVVRYRGVAAASCAACHADPHGGAMAGACSDCHRTVGWRDVRRDRVEGRFDHASASFQLEGVHAALDCAACHDPQATARPGLRLSWSEATLAAPFPRPRFDGCTACHVDEHDGAFEARPGGGSCDGCHGQQRWIPARYDLDRHDREAGFPLVGAHRTVPCALCHRPDGELVLRPEAESCASCHASDDPHGGQFADRGCDACHSPESFRIPDFDHDRTGYTLTGAHADAPCAACHEQETGPDGQLLTRYSPMETTCRSCHTEPS